MPNLLIHAGILNVFAELPDRFVDAVAGNDANNGQSEVNAWKTVGKVNTESSGFLAGMIIAFKRGQNHSDAKLQPAAAGSSGNPIVFTDYGAGTKPRLGSTSLRRICDINVQWIKLKNLRLESTDGAAGTTGALYINASNFEWDNCELDGNSPGANGCSGVWIEDGAINVLLSGGFIDNVLAACVKVQGTASGIVQNMILGNHAQSGHNGDPDPQGDCMSGAPDHTGTMTIINVIFDADDTTFGENCLDAKGGGIWHITLCMLLNSRQSAMIVGYSAGSGSSVVNMNYCYVAQNTTSRILNIGLTGGGVDTNILNANRTVFYGINGTDEYVRLHSNATAIFQVCAFYIPASSSILRVFDLDDTSDLTLLCCSLVARNGNSLQEFLWMRSTFSGTVLNRNNIWSTNGTSNLIFDVDTAASITQSFNLYHSLNSGTVFSINGSNFTLAQVPSSYGGSNSVTGDPNFASLDPANDNFLLLNSGSPAENAGNDSFGPSTDLKDVSYGSPKNIGCRAGVAA